RRRSILNLSDEGQRVHDDVAALALAFERDLLQGIDEKTYADFDRALDRLLDESRRLDTLSE
ncbi:MAG: hypothetical protein OEN22_10935, partial [Gammaproteobacteria bacterium]|nr:hypothetical protein [Gammaproteobacteria bacterium]